MSADQLAETLVAAIAAELAALEAEDADAILAATAEKTAALAALQAAIGDGAQPPRGLIEQARDLNAQAVIRSRAKLLAVGKRLAALQPAAMPPRETLAYGRDGRWA
ncbi:MAG: hypothetical protein KGQ52_07925 [Alphaproteobacteria bacterium]|nr:hypothetical protein [Alphaproteobacteria bacterium]